GIFALSEQNNLQGVCDLGSLPDRLPGYAVINGAAGRALCEETWGCEVPTSPGLSARSLLAGQGNVKALWLCRYDPLSTALLSDAASSVRRCEFVVVQHLFMT